MSKTVVNRHPNRNAQQDKQQVGRVKNKKNDPSLNGGKVIKSKHKERVSESLKPIEGKSDKQKLYLKYLQSNDYNAVVVEGIFGTGKTYCSSCVAADALIKGEVEKIIVARPYVQTGKTSGFRPGDTLEKLYPYVRNVLDTIKERMGDSAYKAALKDGLTGSIEVQAIEDIRGRSFDQPSFLLIEEAQQTTKDEMKAIVTRVSDSCKLIISGDNSQKDIKGETGLTWFIDFVARHKIPNVAHIKFNEPDDIIRGGLCKEIALGLYYDNDMIGN